VDGRRSRHRDVVRRRDIHGVTRPRARTRRCRHSEAGGAPLETLFVDEGFGTLDDQALDEVIDVLDGLRQAGRAVGVVSHVAELRHRIPTRFSCTRRQKARP
jgi:ABC-type lipoprotein export system ATPase subunit